MMLHSVFTRPWTCYAWYTVIIPTFGMLHLIYDLCHRHLVFTPALNNWHLYCHAVFDTDIFHAIFDTDTCHAICDMWHLVLILAILYLTYDTWDQYLPCYIWHMTPDIGTCHAIFDTWYMTPVFDMLYLPHDI